MNYILDFCASCQILLENGIIVCPNCGYQVLERSQRLQGIFSEDDGKKMLEGYYFDNHENDINNNDS